MQLVAAKALSFIRVGVLHASRVKSAGTNTASSRTTARLTALLASETSSKGMISSLVGSRTASCSIVVVPSAPLVGSTVTIIESAINGSSLSMGESMGSSCNPPSEALHGPFEAPASITVIAAAV
ncbi:hypothetical protein ABW19_dt0206081 [Dactylella cylindrospora]|nr:hypothetical protein ABW19_dt0206081 [Dactylella cylindrospora]